MSQESEQNVSGLAVASSIITSISLGCFLIAFMASSGSSSNGGEIPAGGEDPTGDLVAFFFGSISLLTGTISFFRALSYIFNPKNSLSLNNRNAKYAFFGLAPMLVFFLAIMWLTLN